MRHGCSHHTPILTTDYDCIVTIGNTADFDPIGPEIIGDDENDQEKYGGDGLVPELRQVTRTIGLGRKRVG